MHMSKRGKKRRRRRVRNLFRVLKVCRLKRKIRQQASIHAQDVERYQKEIQELKYGRDIMTLYSTMLAIHLPPLWKRTMYLLY